SAPFFRVLCERAGILTFRQRRPLPSPQSILCETRGIRSSVLRAAPVTSNLDLQIQRADHRQGGGGLRKNRESGPKSFVVKLLTSKPLRLKILQSIFANPAPVKPFRRVGKGGYPTRSPGFPGTKHARDASR